MRLHTNEGEFPIITDRDIIMTDENMSADTGKSLHRIINEHDSKIERLESNVKWMYRYGALGSGGTGGGSGSGSSSKLTVFIYKDGKQPISPGTRLMYSGEGYYKFKIELHGGGNDTFLVKYYYNDGKNTLSRVLSKDNEFSTEDTLKLEGNNILTITIKNQSTGDFYTLNDSPNLSFPYVTSSYNITANYVLGSNISGHNLPKYNPNNNTIFMNDIVNSGVMLALNFNVAIDLLDTSSRIEYNDWNDRNIVIDSAGMHISWFDEYEVEQSETRQFDMKFKSNSSGVIYLPLSDDIIEFLSDNNNASFKQVTLKVYSQLPDETDPSEFASFMFFDNLIPNGLFLNIRTDAGKLYTNSTAASTAQTSNQIIGGDIIFKATPYNGSLDLTRLYELRINVYDITDNNEELISSHGPTQLIDQQESDVVIACSDPGVKRLSFMLTYNGTTVSYNYYIQIRSFTSSFNWYPDDASQTGQVITPYYTAVYKRNENIINMSSSDVFMSKDTNIQMTSNDRTRTINFNYDSVYNNMQPKNYDTLLGIGIQYSSINDITKPILSFNIKNSTDIRKGIYTIFVFQDKIAVTTSITSTDTDGNVNIASSDNISIFIPLEDNYEPANTEKFHMLNIYKRLENVSGNNNRRSFSIYIDGILEGIFNKFETAEILYDSITLYPGNYVINLLEDSLFEHASTTGARTWLEDIDMNRYYKAYSEKIIYRHNIFSEDDARLFDIFNTFKYDSGNRILVDSSTALNVAKYASCPVLVLNFDDTLAIQGFNSRNTDNFMEWFEGSYDETDSTVGNIPVTIQYSDGKTKNLKYVNMPNADNSPSDIPAEFSVDIQGSSTKTYKVKNLELKAPASDELDDFIYTPNLNRNVNDPEYTSSFLPEGSFTLKADVVDSSHTNNNAIGKFVNDNTTQFRQAVNNINQHGTKYTKNIKNTLIGFPVLVFLNTRYMIYAADGTPTGQYQPNHYFLGIYNFNLGRKSYYNLGYKDIKNIEDIIDSDKAPDSGFVVYRIDKSKNVQMRNIVGGEIQGNNPYFDFSQYDNYNLLFDAAGAEMWGDYIGSKSENEITTSIKNFCRDVAYAGGYTFTQIGKKMSDDLSEKYGYAKLYSKKTQETDENGNVKTVEWVPNYHYQASIIQQSGTEINYNYTFKEGDGTLSDLRKLIVEYDIDNTTNIPRLDFKSVSEYYTTMMAFGMVDSPMKNLNIKSWNNGETFYTAFYDMDTGLGKNNAGTYINYFAYSDFWESQWIKAQNNNYGTLNQVSVVRDYSPESFVDDETGSSFFDVPSNYLFAIAKYAKSVFKAFDSTNTQDYVLINDYDPSNIWGRWRKKVWETRIDEQTGEKITEYIGNNIQGEGCLQNAEIFMNKYFNHHLANIPVEAFNFNYRYKYLVKDKLNTGFDDHNYIKFHGRGLAYTAYWLDGRLHILDAYFNVSGINDVINIKNNIIVRASYTDTDYRPSNNPDVYILQDTFSGEARPLQYTGMTSSGGILIEAKNYAPLIVQTPMSMQRYLFPSDGRSSMIDIDLQGNVNVLYGGSMLWTSIGSIAPFITQGLSFSIYSKYISTLIGESRTCTTWTFDTPALRTLRLTSPNYSGVIKFTSETSEPKYQNLDEINISETAINLTVSGVPLRKLYAVNMKPGAQIMAAGLTRLEDVQISGTFNDLQISSWNSIVSLPTTGGKLTCNTITITNDTARFPDATLNISNNSELTLINVSGFTHIYISNCPKLTKINFNDNSNEIKPRLKTLDIQMPRFNDEQTFTIGNIDNVVDLSNFDNLETLRLTNTTITHVYLPVNPLSNGDRRRINLPGKAFANCKNFINFKNETYNDLYITELGSGTDGVFMNTGSAAGDNKFRLVQYGHSENATGEGYPTITNLYIDSSCTSLKDTFNYTDGKGAINYNVASKFLQERCTDESVKNVLNIDNMFRNNNINYTYEDKASEYIRKECSLPLWGFVNCTSATDIFTNNNVTFFNRYMFENNTNGQLYAQYVETYNLTTMCNNFSFGTIDMLYPFISKTISIDFKNQKNIMIYVPITGNIYNISNVLKVSDIFKNPYKLMSIQNFTLSPTYKTVGGSTRSQTYDFTGMFDNDKENISEYTWIAAHEQSLSLQNFMNAGYTIIDYDISSVNKLFCNIVPSSIIISFGGFSLTSEDLTDTDKKLNIYTMFNWDLVRENTLYLFSNEFSGTTVFGGIDVNKRCEYNEFKTIWNAIISSSIRAISSIFTNCDIYNNWADDEIFVLSDIDTVNTSLTTVPSLFKSLRLMNDEEIIPININSLFLKNLSSLKYVPNMFEGIYMKHAIPFNIFNKRYKVESRKNYYILNNDNEYVQARLAEYVYNNEIVNMNNTFAEITFEDKTSATFTHDTESANNYNVIDRNYVFIANNPDVRYYTYYTYSNNHYTEHSVEQPTEVQDVDNLNNGKYSSTYSYEVPDYSFKNVMTYRYRNLTNFCPDGFLVSPDIFRCCSENCNIHGALQFNRNNVYDPVIMTGMVPPSLFGVDYLRKIDFGGTLYGLNATPIYMGNTYEYDDIVPRMNEQNIQYNVPRHNICYRFIWDNFTDRDSLSDCFNFMLLLPSSTSEFNDNSGLEVSRTSEHFFMFGIDSISKDVMKMANSLPIDINKQVLQDTDVNHMHNHYLSDNGIYFNIMGYFDERIISATDDEIITETRFVNGIDPTKFRSLIFDNLINGDIARIYDGYIITDTATWRSTYVSDSSTVLYQVGGNNTGWTGLSANARIQVTLENNGFAPRAGNGYHINKKSLVRDNEFPNSPMISQYWQNYDWPEYVIL